MFDHPHLRVQAASARHLVAMKSLAGRQQDLEDLGTLVAQLDLKSADEVLEIISEVFPSEELSDRRRLRIEDMFSEQGRAAPPDRRVGRAQIPA
ncbi:MAG: hypothetical protein M3415_05965 [Actinomycetota bacterium]|nr:hypothetical protein [Actinomycetota bacterium]